MDQFYLLFNAFTLMNVVILSAILIFRKNNSVANIILALIILNPGLNFVNNIIIHSGAIFKMPYFLFLFQGSAQLYAPLVLAYVYLMMGERFKWISVLSGLTLIVILLDAYYAFTFSRLTNSEQIVYLQGLTNGHYPSDMEVINNLFGVNLLAYFVVALIKIKKYRKSAFDFFSDVVKLKVRYIRWFVVLLTTLNVALMISYVAFPTPIVEYIGIPLIIIIMYIYIVVYAFNHSAVLSEPEYCNFKAEVEPMGSFLKFQEPRCKELKEIKSNSNKYKLTEIEMTENYQIIKEYLEQQKPYLDPNINLTKFSSVLNACSHNISMTINCKFEMNFFDLINSNRVEYAKMRLLSFNKNQLTIESVGIESGFTSMSSFYRAFKKYANCTPSEFLKEMNKDAA